MKKSLHHIREDYQTGSLNENEVNKDPVLQFIVWFEEFQNLNTKDFNAMTLSTVDENLQPDSRVVLLKSVTQGGFEFFTNYKSRKGRQIAQNNRVSLNFYWSIPERQVKIKGFAEKLSEAESDEYFAIRPRGSQIGAWTSPQSEVIENRDKLEEYQRNYEDKFSGMVPRPEHWGGYRVIPFEMEFWQGRGSRLHDRLLYVLNENKVWEIKRLAP